MSIRSYVPAGLCLLLFVALTVTAKEIRAPQKSSANKTAASKSHPAKARSARPAVSAGSKRVSSGAQKAGMAKATVAKKRTMKAAATKSLKAANPARTSTKTTLVAMRTSSNANAARGSARPKAAEASLRKKPVANAAPVRSKKFEQVKTTPASAPNGIALFAVSQNQKGAFLDPIVLLRDGRFISPPTGDGTIAQATKFANTYYREGQKYRLLFGGGQAGEIIVKQWNLRKACSRTQAAAEIGSSEARINGRVMGLATNSKLLGRKERSRRFPTEKEKNAIYALAVALYKQKGVSEAELKDIQRVNITATDLNGDGKAEIIGTFMVKRPAAARIAHILFLIAEPHGKSYKTAVSQYGEITAKDVGGTDKLDELGETALAEILVDQIDLDRDGTAEVIIADMTAEGVAYKIFKKQKNQWRKAYEFYNLRCAN